MGNRVALHNLGCKVNAYEIEAMQQLLEEAGYEIVPFEPGADIYVINTCTVTNIADRKLEKDEAIDLVLGNNQKINIVEALAEYAENKPGHGSHVIKINQTKEYEDLSIDHTAEHVRAYIKVQDGCNQFCTYCIIPYARGRVRSRNIESVLKEVRSLAEKGYKEVVLTGIHLSSYGVDFPEEKKETLLSLIRAVHEIEGIQRIRLGSLEPGIVTRKFAEGIAALPKVCPHFHLSLQSGCDETLERMNRRYRSGEYRERCELLREVYGNPALTTDVIVGFPQESEEEFQKSYDFVDGIHFYETHIFKYSRRQGTKAAVMDGQLTEAEKARRSEKMIEMHHRHASDYEKSMIGKELEVLIEEEYTNDGRTWYLGHSREYIKTAVPKSENYGVNDIIRVKAERFLEEHIMTGEVVK